MANLSKTHKRGKKLDRQFRIRKVIFLSLILLVSTLLLNLDVPRVFAEVSISELSPSQGFVGTVVSITGTINTANGSYKIFFDGEEVDSGNATQNQVSATFTILNSTFGNHPVTLQDVSTGENGTADFAVKTKYTIKALTPAHPRQLQEGNMLTVLGIITGGNATVFKNVTITVEDPANVTYSSNLTIHTVENGYGEANKTYALSFDANAHTFYVGLYNMSLKDFDETLAMGNFTIGLTDAMEYNRFQTVNVQAMNYTANDILKITITHNDKTVFESPAKNATDPGGKIMANWTIPANATLGLYTVDVENTTAPLKAEKPVPDSQTFTIVSKSFACEVKAFNLDNEPVKGTSIEAKNMTSIAATNTTDKRGIAVFYLGATNYTFTAFLNNSKVGAISDVSLAGNLTGASALNINCSLAHIKVAVNDAEDNLLPFVVIGANFTYTTRTNATISTTVSTETNLTGIGILRNLFINTNYTVKASRYSQTFDTTTMNLTFTSWFNTTCPTRELVIRVLDRNSLPMRDVQVKVYDWGVGFSGLVGEGITSTSGEIAFNFTFGKYTVTVYKNNILLNKTVTLLANQPTDFTVHCKLYNLTLDVNVLDYFGQKIANANVTIEREGTTYLSLNTAGDGVAEFRQLIGGNYTIFVYIDGKPYEITKLYLQEPKIVNVKIDGIVSIGGLITETSYFATAVLILLLSIVFVLAFFYRRLKLGQKRE